MTAIERFNTACRKVNSYLYDLVYEVENDDDPRNESLKSPSLKVLNALKKWKIVKESNGKNDYVRFSNIEVSFNFSEIGISETATDYAKIKEFGKSITQNLNCKALIASYPDLEYYFTFSYIGFYPKESSIVIIIKWEI